MLFRVRALLPTSSIAEVEIEAIDRPELDSKVRERMLVPLSIREARTRTGFSRAGGFSATLFSQELQTLLNAGLSIVEAIESLHEKETSGRRRAVLESILRSLREGFPLSIALERIPGAFTPLYLGIIRAAEGTSDLPTSLARYLAYRRRIELLQNQLISAAIYPTILLIVGLLVSLFLMGYVVPRFASVYEAGAQQVPFASRLLLAGGRFIGSNQAAVLVVFGLSVSAVAVGAKAAWKNGVLITWASRVAGIGGRIRIVELSRLYMTLGMLLEGGIPIKTAIRMSASAVSSPLQAKLAAVEELIKEGASLSAAFSRYELSTPITTRLMRVGEKSGQMGEMLTQTAQFYEEETSRWMARFSKIFEPLLMAGIGLLVGGIVILLYMPIFDLAGSIQ